MCIRDRYKTAREAHKDQARKSGEPYITHPLCVAIILADLELDKETIVAGLLHDAVEDTIMTVEEVAAGFGSEVALLAVSYTHLELTYYVICDSIHHMRKERMFMRSDRIKKGMEAAPQRALLYALGLTEEEMEKPLIGIVSSWNEIVDVYKRQLTRFPDIKRER